MNISIIGTGYVGLVTGTCLAEKGHRVICVDVDEAKVNMINRGVPPIYERGLEELLRRNIGTRLTATSDLPGAIHATDVSLIAVGTPFDGSAIDLKYIRAAAQQIGTVLHDKPAYHLVVVKSTVVPGTTDGVVLPALEEASGKRAGVDFGVGMNPEFLREGEAVDDFMAPDRIVLGGIDERSIEILARIYAGFEDVTKVRTSTKTAEMIKYAANSLLATLISFSNEIGNLCTTIGGVDVVDVMRGVHLDKRLSPIMLTGERVTPAITTYLEAGCGFGGSCFPKDVKALIAYGRNAGLAMGLLDAVIEVNEAQPGQVLALLKEHFPTLEGVRVAVLGLAFKPGTDDMRESPAIPVVQALRAAGARLIAYDPIARHEAVKVFADPAITYADTMAQAIRDAQAIVIMTRWEEFKALPALLANIDSQPLVVDGRRMLDRHSIARYIGIGLSA